MSEPPVEIGPDDVRPAPRHVGHRLLDLAIALTAIFLSIVSLVVAIEHGHTQRQLVAANSWPFLGMGLSLPDDSGKVALVLANSGSGPAKIEYVQLYYKNKPVSSLKNFIETCCQRKEHLKQNVTLHVNLSGVDGTVMRPGEESRLISIISPIDNAEMRQKLPLAIASLTFKACYCSIFDECWVSNLNTLHPQKVEHCPVNDHPFVVKSAVL